MADLTNAEVSDERLREAIGALETAVSVKGRGGPDRTEQCWEEIEDIILNRRSVTSQASEGAEDTANGPGTLVYAASSAVVAIDAFVSDPVGKRSTLTEAADQLMVAMQASRVASPSKRVERLETATHRHVKRGSEYVLLGYGKMQAENWQEKDRRQVSEHVAKIYYAPVDMREVAIYRSVDDGSLWVRPREEFEDGRFQALGGRS